MKDAFRLSSDQLALFRRRGYIGPFDLYEPQEMREKYRRIRSALFDRTNAVYELSTTSVLASYDRHLDIDELSAHVMRREIVQRVKGVLGPDLVCWRTEIFPKYPGDEGTDWHQADTFAHASGQPQLVWPGDTGFGGAITVWTALTDATEENGCLRFIPGTHEEMFYDESQSMEYSPQKVNAVTKAGVRRGFFGYDYRNLQKDADWIPDESQAVSIPMKAGQFVIFWSTLMHSSLPNTTTNATRLGFASRYVPSSVDVYPNTEFVEEYGSTISLERYGAVVVSGSNSNPRNRILTQSATGFDFSRCP